MPIDATFDSDRSSFALDNISGYRLATAFSPTQGFQGRFYAYLTERIAANEELAAVDFGAPTPKLRGTLKLSGESRSYELRDIDLVSVHTVVTRREKLRWIELRYDARVSDTHALPVELQKNQWPQLEIGAWGNDYQYALDGDGEQLFGLSALQPANGGAALRLACVGSPANSWLLKLRDLADGRVSDKQRRMPDFVLHLRGDDLAVDSNNLAQLLVEESYGDFLVWPSSELEDVVANPQADHAEHRLDMHSALTLVEHHTRARFEHAVRPETVETATLVFQPNAFRSPVFV